MNYLQIMFCNSEAGMKVLSFFGKMFDMILIIIPIILIIYCSIDFIKALTSRNTDDMKQIYKTCIKRLIIAMAIFFVMPIVSFLMSLLDEKVDNQCMTCFNTPDACKITTTPTEETDEAIYEPKKFEETITGTAKE